MSTKTRPRHIGRKPDHKYESVAYINMNLIYDHDVLQDNHNIPEEVVAPGQKIE
jgi:hypothetical protein